MLEGAFREEAPIGTCIIPTSAISEEGTSPHYVEEGTKILPDTRLVTIAEESCRKEGIAALTGPV
ncbi:MAG: hypothetical protein NVS2B16_19240 [Chloroflexota bacterium]